MEPTDGGLDAAEGRRWLAALPTELGRQRDLLARLIDLSVGAPAAYSLSVGCSMGRGGADARSDVDAALGVDAARGEPGADQVMSVEDAVVSALAGDGSIIDVLRDRIGPPAGRPVPPGGRRHVGAGAQVDVSRLVRSRRSREVPAPRR